MLLFIIPLFITVILGISFGNYLFTSKILDEHFQNVSTQLTNRIVISLEEWLEARKADVLLYSTNAELISAVQAGDIARQRAYIDSEKAKWEKTLLGFFVSDKSGNAWTTVNDQIVSIADRPYFPKVLKGEIVISDPVIAKGDGKTKVVVIVAPVMNASKEVIGTIGATVTLNDLFGLVGESPLGQHSLFYMLTSDGTVITHPKAELAMKYNFAKDEQNQTLKQLITEHALKEEKGIGKYPQDDEERYLFYQKISGPNWVFVSEVSEKAATEITGKSLKFTMLMGVLGLLVAVAATFLVVMRITRPIGALKETVAHIAGNDLSHGIQRVSNDELGDLGLHIDDMRASLKGIVTEVKDASENVTDASKQLRERSSEAEVGIHDIGNSIDNIATGANEVAAAVSEVTYRVGSVADHVDKLNTDSREMNSVAGHSAKLAREGLELSSAAIGIMHDLQKSMDRSTDVINQLGENAEKVEEMVTLISGITAQTNLLALNAAIEAARAGESGRGFAVVAEEVRKLADESNRAAAEIANIVAETRVRVALAIDSISQGNVVAIQSGEVMEKVNNSFTTIAHDVENIFKKAEGISLAVEQLKQDSVQISNEMEGVTAITEESAAAAEEMNQILKQQQSVAHHVAFLADELSSLSEHLHTITIRFRT